MLRLKDRINLNEDIAMPQDIKDIDINDLVLWTDNPRDPFNKNASNQEIADRAISTDGRSRWNLKNLFKSMHLKSKPGSYDKSQIPIVVYDDGIPLVYDGNRRVLIGKIIHGCVEVETDIDFSNFDFPKKLPCNVCDKETALDNIELKHAKGGSWKPLERDIFMYNRGGENPSFFMVLNNDTDIISKNIFMNQGFVKKEVFSNETLKRLNLSVKNNKLDSPYSNNDLKIILDRIVELVHDEIITTRENRYNVISLLEKDTKIANIISKNKNKKCQSYTGKKYTKREKETPPSAAKQMPLFGRKLHLKDGVVNHLYLDLKRLHADSKKYTPDLPMIIRIGLRLLCEFAEKELNPKSTTKLVEYYIKRHFSDAKAKRTQEEREYFHTNDSSDLEEADMIGLLQKSGHPGTSTVSKEKTVVISIILGKILEKTHGAETSK